MLACRPHWFQLPQFIRREIWGTYRKGQEVDKRPSRAYLAAFQKAEDFWTAKLNEREVKS